MNIEGLDYNTQREKLVLPEYGREIQNMVDFTCQLPTKELRQRGANTIVRIMASKLTQQAFTADKYRTLWDHLYMMSKTKEGGLDIDWPFDTNEAEKITEKPEPVRLPGKEEHVKLRHYGRLLEEMFVVLQEMSEGEERDNLVRLVANQMKLCLHTWGHGNMDDERVASDLAHFTNGVIQLDLSSFKFDKLPNETPLAQQRKKRK